MNDLESAPIEPIEPIDPITPIQPIQSVTSAGITLESVDELRYQLEKITDGRLKFDREALEKIPIFLRTLAKQVKERRAEEILLKAAEAMEKGNPHEALLLLREIAPPPPPPAATI